MSEAQIEKCYLPARTGQVHARRIGPAAGDHRPPLVCLHPAPSSGLYFTTVLPLINPGRTVLAPDYPGYGGSDGAGESPTIGDYADAMLDALDAAKLDAPADLLGFHTGCLVACEMSLRAPEKTGRLLMIDVPYFDADTQAKLLPSVATPLPLGPELECLDKAWDFNVGKRIADLPIDRAFDLFIENLRSGTGDHLAFRAAFTYDCADRFARIEAPTTVLATRSPLLEPSHAAAAGIAGASLVDVEDVTTAVFEKGAATIAGYINRALADD